MPFPSDPNESCWLLAKEVLAERERELFRAESAKTFHHAVRQRGGATKLLSYEGGKQVGLGLFAGGGKARPFLGNGPLYFHPLAGQQFPRIGDPDRSPPRKGAFERWLFRSCCAQSRKHPCTSAQGNRSPQRSQHVSSSGFHSGIAKLQIRRELLHMCLETRTVFLSHSFPAPLLESHNKTRAAGTSKKKSLEDVEGSSSTSSTWKPNTVWFKCNGAAVQIRCEAMGTSFIVHST